MSNVKEFDFYVWQNILIYLYECRHHKTSITSIAIKLQITYSHINKYIHILKDSRLILIKVKDKRTKNIILTTKGKLLGKRLSYVNKIVNYKK